jgi:hypothetical protein
MTADLTNMTSVPCFVRIKKDGGESMFFTPLPNFRMFGLVGQRNQSMHRRVINLKCKRIREDPQAPQVGIGIWKTSTGICHPSPVPDKKMQQYRTGSGIIFPLFQSKGPAVSIGEKHKFLQNLTKIIYV